jgi:hypothetical protein
VSEQLMFTATALGINMHCMNDHGLVNLPSCFVHINWQPPGDRQGLQLLLRACNAVQRYGVLAGQWPEIAGWRTIYTP